MGKKVLFLVGSIFQLMNVITLRMTERAEEDCDLMLRSSTKWDEATLQRIEASGLFNRILCPDLTKKEEEFWFLSLEEKMERTKEPLVFFEEYPVEPIYDELFAGVGHTSWKLLYRYHALNGKYPSVYMFDEGIRSYTLDTPKMDDLPYLQNEYSETRFVDAIVGYYLHQPELYSVEEYAYELLEIPNPSKNPKVKEMLLSVFGVDAMPVEPYIYLEDYFFVDRYVTNDLELFHQLADVVGKDNVIAKCHPRDDFDRFAADGYKTVERSVVPWEIQLLSNDLTDKVLISISSTSILSPYIIFDSDMHVISLEKMFMGENPVHSDRGFRTFFNKLINKVNGGKEVRFHTPGSVEELKEVVRYIRFTQQTRE